MSPTEGGERGPDRLSRADERECSSLTDKTRHELCGKAHATGFMLRLGTSSVPQEGKCSESWLSLTLAERALSLTANVCVIEFCVTLYATESKEKVGERTLD